MQPLRRRHVILADHALSRHSRHPSSAATTSSATGACERLGTAVGAAAGAGGGGASISG
jgi:hypothetical protein